MGGDAHPIFVLTDNAVLYLLLGQLPPYHVNLYNSSPIYEQEKTDRWIGRMAPERVVFDTRQIAFDGVPHVVRAPVLFAAVIESYVLHRTEGPMDILRRRRAGEPVALDYWQGRLGKRFEAGDLGAASTVGTAPPCTAPASCREVLMVNTAEPGKPVTVPVQVGGQVFEIAFTARPGQSHFALPLDRVWFWAVPRRGGIPVRIAEERLTAGVDVQIVSRADTRTLY